MSAYKKGVVWVNGERVDQERAAADIAMGAIDLLPEVLDARRVLAVEELKQRLRELNRDVRLQPRHFPPPDDAFVRLDLDVRLRPHPKCRRSPDR